MTPRFVPFESMSDAEQREHLRDWHGCHWHMRSYWPIPHPDPAVCHRFATASYLPHTHDKPAPRPKENR